MVLLPPGSWPAPTTPYEAEALAFCEAWQAGQSDFTLQTSGSTGTPKPIRLSRAQMQASAQLTGKTLGLQTGDHALVCLSIRYVAGIMMLVRGLELGLPMTIVEPSGHPLTGFASPADHFDFTALVPLQLQTMLEAIQTDGDKQTLALLNSMKAILIGGAATSPALERALQIIEAPIYATYGMTETVSHIALRRLNGPNASDLFTALDGVTLGVDARGCLSITSAATNFERIQTNDVVELLTSETGEPTRFRLVGRADRIINSGGVKIQPETIEQFIQTYASQQGISPVPRLFVAAQPDERLGQRIVLVVEGAGSGERGEDQDRNGLTGRWPALQDAIRQRLGPYFVPKYLFSVDHFAETPTGKVDQRAILQQIS